MAFVDPLTAIKREIDKEMERQSKLLPPPYVNVRKPAPYDGVPNELVLSSDLNTTIILGGAPQNTPEIAKPMNSSTITLVSGMGTAIKNMQPPLSAGKLTLSNKFYYDSAVIQISEQTDVDTNFGAKIRDPKALNASAVAMKADEIRLFSRGSVKIITGIDQMEKDQVVADSTAPAHPKRDFSGIHLIANNAVENEGELHPLVLGRNLEEFLDKVLNEIKKLYAVIQEVTDAQIKINEAVRDHTHLSDFTAKPLPKWTDPNLSYEITLKNTTISELATIKTNTKKIPNIENLRKNYLRKNPRKYINSYFNKTN